MTQNNTALDQHNPVVLTVLSEPEIKVTLHFEIGCAPCYDWSHCKKGPINPVMRVPACLIALQNTPLNLFIVQLVDQLNSSFNCKLTIQQISGLSKLILNTYFPKTDQLHAMDDSYISHSCLYIADLIGRCYTGTRHRHNCLKPINDLLNIFNIKDDWKKGSHTKGYKLADWLMNAINGYIDAVYWSEAALLVKHEDTCSDKRKAITSLDDGGKRRKTRGNLRLAVKVNTLEIRKLIRKGDHTETEKRHATRIIDAAQGDDLPSGWIAHPYREISTGRLYSFDMSLQNVCRRVRNAALTGCYKLDMSNAHYTILSQAAGKAGIELNGINYYLSNKKQVRKTLADDIFNGELAKAKTALIALIYGASTSRESYFSTKGKQSTTLAALAGDNFKKLINHPLFKSIADDVKTGGGVLIDNGRQRAGELFNVLGKPIKLSAIKSKQTAHMLQGVEAQALDSMIQAQGANIALLLHDGVAFYNKVDAIELMNGIYNATGYKIILEEE